MTEELITEIVAQIAAVRTELIDKIKALEERPGVKYRGIWNTAEKYAVGDLTTHDGSLWHANSASVGVRPGSQSQESRSWVLVAKRGRDGKDADGVTR